MSPLSNLFAKHMGSVYERYKQVESAFEVLQDRFNKDPTAYYENNSEPSSVYKWLKIILKKNTNNIFTVPIFG
jgi:hypothetical protein